MQNKWLFVCFAFVVEYFVEWIMRDSIFGALWISENVIVFRIANARR